MNAIEINSNGQHPPTYSFSLTASIRLLKNELAESRELQIEN